MALGHNALGTNLPAQKIAVTKTAKIIADFIQEGWQIALVHSNAPQVGMIHAAMNEFPKQNEGYTSAPMSVCSAMSQGYIGYDLQNGIRVELLKRGIHKTVSTVLTQVMVDPYDESFYNPIKKVGRIMSREEADAEELKGNHVIEIKPNSFQRIVSAPKPVSIVEIDAIRALLDADQVVIACGGGGIPVMAQDYNLRGASAVIEKDLAGGLLAKEVNADVFMIVTDVEYAYLNYNKDGQTPIKEMTVSEAEAYIEQGEFAGKSMLPKVESSISFIKAGNQRTAIITSCNHALDALHGKTGTQIK